MWGFGSREMGCEKFVAMSATALLHRKALLNPVARCNVFPRSSTNSTTSSLSMAFVKTPAAPSLAASRSPYSLLASPFLADLCKMPLLGRKPGNKERRAKTEICASLATPLIVATDAWGTWTVLLVAGAFGLW